MKKHQFRENAQALVEFALLLFLLIVMVIGVLDLGRATYYFSAVYNAAREGARYGSVHPNSGDAICTRAQPISIGMTLGCVKDNPCSSSGNDICVNKDTTNPAEAYIEVTVVYQFQPVTPLVLQAFGISTLPISSTSRMFIEGIPLN